MKKEEIFELECSNEESIYLYLEGNFWKAYERSAFLFVKNIKPYRAKKTFVKYIGRDIVSIGFPGSVAFSIRRL